MFDDAKYPVFSAPTPTCILRDCPWCAKFLGAVAAVSVLTTLGAWICVDMCPGPGVPCIGRAAWTWPGETVLAGEVGGSCGLSMRRSAHAQKAPGWARLRTCRFPARYSSSLFVRCLVPLTHDMLCIISVQSETAKVELRAHYRDRTQRDLVFRVKRQPFTIATQCEYFAFVIIWQPIV